MIGFIHVWIERFRSFFNKPELDRDFENEISTHLEMAVEENLRQGMSAEEARRQALIRFGGVEQAKEQHRDARGLPFLDSILQDLRFTVPRPVSASTAPRKSAGPPTAATWPKRRRRFERPAGANVRA